jgi:hypothetical protein
MTVQPQTLTVRKPPREALRDLEQVVVQGNLATLSENERIGYYARVCESLGLNPLTRPFEYITLNGKLTLYARKDATDQLRDIHGVSIPLITATKHEEDHLFVVVAQAEDRYGRKDSGMGVVSIAGLKGENLANAMMKAETKAKRRATLSICGLGWMDEVEALDRQAVEVAPRAALAEGIKSRRAAIESASREAPSAGVSTGEDVPASVASSPAVECDHRGYEYKATPDGLECPNCGKLVASFDGEVIPEPKPAPRGRRKAAEPKKAGDEGYGTARAHAIAAERGLDHDAVHRIAADLNKITDADDDFSVADLGEVQWQEIIAAIAEAPITTKAKDAEQFAGSMALQAGLGKDDDPWSEADPMLADMFGHGDPFSASELLEFGIRVYARNPLP